MPSSINDFNNNPALIRPEFGLDINDDTIAEDLTNKVDYIDIFETAEEIAGIKNMTLDSQLVIQSPTIRYTDNGINCYTSVKTTGDNWTSEIEEAIFVGSTVRANTLPLQEVKIKATSLNSNYLEKKSTRQVFLNQDIADIMTDLLTSVGVSAGSIDLASAGHIVPVYFVSDKIEIKHYINDLAKAVLWTVGFGRDGVFRATSQINQLFNASPVADVTLTRSQQEPFENRPLKDDNYYNDILVRTKSYQYITDSTIYYSGDLTGYEIKPYSQLFFKLKLEKQHVVSINTMIARNKVSNIETKYGYTDNSYFEFYTSDDVTSTVSNLFIAISFFDFEQVNETEEELTIMFTNNGGQSLFLKEIILNGSYVNILDDYTTRTTLDTQITNDGKRYSLEYLSNAIQSTSQAGNILNYLILNLSRQATIYSFQINGRPQLEIGSIVQFQLVDGTDKLAHVIEIDSTISQDVGYKQRLKLREVQLNMDYLELDNSSHSLDNTNYKLF